MHRRLALSLFPVFLPLSACSGDAAWQALLARNAGTLHPPARMDSLLAAESDRPVAERIGLWARRFAEAKDPRYLFGLAEGGYAKEGLLVDDHALDCVSLVYRVCELARSHSESDALRIALATRFAGVPADSLYDAEGRVDYDRPEHLDYSLDMVRSGHWGLDVTRRLSGAAPDGTGSSRYAADSFWFVPEIDLVESELREGDLVWLVLNPAHADGRRLRFEHGLVIGHLGVVIVEDGRPWLVHAASSPLEGWYEGGRVVAVPLSEYLARVDRFSGLLVTRFEAQD